MVAVLSAWVLGGGQYRAELLFNLQWTCPRVRNKPLLFEATEMFGAVSYCSITSFILTDTNP